MEKTKNRKLLIVIFAILIPSLMFQMIIRGKKAPEIPLSKSALYDEKNQEISLDQYNGKVIIVSYFQTWCGDCRKEQPELSQLQKAVGSDMLTVILISDETFDKINEMKNYLHSDLTFFRSEKSLKEIGIKRYPTTYLLNKKGEVVESKVEGIQWNTKKIRDLIIKLNN